MKRVIIYIVIFAVLGIVGVVVYFQSVSNKEQSVSRQGDSDVLIQSNIRDEESPSLENDADSSKQKSTRDENNGTNTEENESDEGIVIPELSLSINFPQDKFELIKHTHSILEKVNCVFIKPKEEPDVASIAIGYDPIEGTPNECFRSNIFCDQDTLVEEMIQIGNKKYKAHVLTCIINNQDQGESFKNYVIHVDNPSLDSSTYKYFVVQVEYYLDEEEVYRDALMDILKTIEWE